MSDKISDKRLEWIRESYVASSKGHAFIGHPSHDEQIAIIDELLISRRATEVKPVELPKAKSMLTRTSFVDSYTSINAVPLADVIAAIKAAGGTVKDVDGDIKP